MKLRNVLFLFLIIICSPAFSQPGGKSTYDFLNLPISARVSSLGGNLISVKDNDLNVSLINPSLLTDSMDNNVALSSINYFADINYGYVAYAKHFNNIGNFSAGIHYLDYGKFTRADEIGNTYGTFGANEMSFNLAYARSILDSNLTVGATLKTIYSHLDTYTSWGSALDVGAT
ncbi:MAG: PorV/PorQ family protein, partial [Bacteroidia bacterium]